MTTKLLAVRPDKNPKRNYNVADCDVELPNGQVRTWSRVEGPDVVVVVAVDDQNRVYMKSEYRLSQEKEILELPSGRLDATDTDTRACAIRELHEEVGVTAERVELLKTVSLWNHATVKANIYLATGLKAGANNPDADEFVKVHPVPLAEVMKRLDAEGTNAQTLLGLYLAAERLGVKHG